MKLHSIKKKYSWIHKKYYEKCKTDIKPISYYYKHKTKNKEKYSFSLKKKNNKTRQQHIHILVHINPKQFDVKFNNNFSNTNFRWFINLTNT